MDALRRTLAEILTRGLLRARSAAEAGDARACWEEANHLHNLPALMTCAEDDLVPSLHFYLTVERPEYEAAVPAARAAFSPLWERLDAWLRERGHL